MENFKNWGKKILKVGIIAGALSLPNKAKSETLPSDSTILNNKTLSKDSTRNPVEKGNVAIYTKSKTKEGGITPTGLSNSFLENEYGITVQDIDTIASMYGFRNDNEKNFQEDMVMYLLKNNPEKIKEVVEKFGQTEYGEKNNLKDYKMLLDGKFGRRMAYLMQFLKKEKQEEKTKLTENKQEENISKIPETKEDKNKIFRLNGFNKLYLLFDVSESMEENKDTLIKDLKSNSVDLPVEFVGFTKEIESQGNASNIQEATKILREAKASKERLELAMDVLINKIKDIENNTDKKLIVVCTDEELQKVTKEKIDIIKNSQAEKNIEVQFTIMRGGKIHNLSIDDISKIYEDKFAKNIDSRVKERIKEIKGREKVLEQDYKELSLAKDNKTKKYLMKKIAEDQEDLDMYKAGLAKIKEVQIIGFEDTK